MPTPINFKLMDEELAKQAMLTNMEQRGEAQQATKEIKSPDHDLEIAAQWIEQMAKLAHERIRKLEVVMAECRDAAAMLRKRGEAVVAQIDEAAHFSKAVKDVCASVIKKAKEG